jgi:hypothetical protein
MMFSGRFVAPTWDRYSSFAQIWLIAHEKIQHLYHSFFERSLLYTSVMFEKAVDKVGWISEEIKLMQYTTLILEISSNDNS